jgi:hypothetical protein
MHSQTRITTAPDHWRRPVSAAARGRPGLRRSPAGLVLAATLLASLAACGGGSDGPPTFTNGALSSEQVAAAQGTVEPSATALDAGAVLTAAQIDTQQRTAVERAAISETASIDEKQAALDAGEGLTPAF